MRIKNEGINDYTLTDKISLNEFIKILEIKNRLLIISESIPKK